MYSVLIVDDELAIREGLTTLLDWNGLGFQIADTAANAIEARHKYDLYGPDLMIVDIRMPGRNGLELIEELREVDPDLPIIILSGYADFHYAKRAMVAGIDNYLLKPVDEEELQNCLKALSSRLNARGNGRRKDTAVKVWSREMMVQSLLMDGIQTSPEETEHSLQESGVCWDSYQIVLIRMIQLEQADNDSSSALKAKLASASDEEGWGIVFSLDSYLGILLQPSFQRELTDKRMVRRIREAATVYGMDCLIAAGDRVLTLREVPDSYRSALVRIRDYFFYDESGMIGPDSLMLKRPTAPATEDPDPGRKLDQTVERLYFAMDIGSRTVIPSLVMEAGETMVLAGYSEMAIKSRYVRMSTYLLNKLSLHYGGASAMNGRMDEQIQQIYRHHSLPGLQRYVISLLEQYAAGLTRDDNEVLIKRMTDLIDRHFGENIKLETLADVFAYSSAYLGKLFKSSTGYSFNGYLDRVRIDKAKELLGRGYKVHQAAAETGFGDVDYFREKFKKMEGVSPSDYRKNHTI